MNFFDFLKGITFEKKNFNDFTDEEKSKYSSFMVNRYISMTDIYLPIVNQINQFDVPKQANYDFYKAILPKRKIFFNYIKKKKGEDLDFKEFLCEYFECGFKEVESHLKCLKNEHVDELKKKFKRLKKAN